MVNVAGLSTRLIGLLVQGQVVDSSGTPLDYEGRIVLDTILLDRVCLIAALETGVFELSNTWVHQNLVLHHLGSSMHGSAILLREICHMVGSPYRPADLQEISWQDLQWVEMARRALLDAMEEIERGSHGNPDQADDGVERTSDHPQ